MQSFKKRKKPESFGIFLNWVFSNVILNLHNFEIFKVPIVAPSVLEFLLEGCEARLCALPPASRTLFLHRVSARLLEQSNPSGGWPESRSLTEMHREEEGVRWREQTLLTLVSP